MYNWLKDIAHWKINGTLYLSVVFTWHLPKARELAKAHKGPVMAGGPAVKLMPDYLSDVADLAGSIPYPAISFHNPMATFTSRGCPNRCSFCAVPRLEGNFTELENWEPRPLICDNNFLASSRRHFNRVIDRLTPFPFVDFQGLEAELFTHYHADRFADLRRVALRFGFDSIEKESAVVKAVTIAQSYGLRNIGVYVLINNDDSPEDAIYRLELVRSLKVRTNPMRFQPLFTLNKNEHVSPGWTQYRLQKVMQYYSRDYYQAIPFDEFEPKTVYTDNEVLF